MSAEAGKKPPGKIANAGTVPRWRRLRRRDFPRAEEFLRAREESCVSACSRFLRMNGKADELWALPGSGGTAAYSALLIYSRGCLFPVFNVSPDRADGGFSLPGLLARFAGKVYVHAIHGPGADAVILEKAMEKRGSFPAERIDYDLMSLDKRPAAESFNYGPPGLVIRPPETSDEEELFGLQAAYEKEEVLPAGSVFHAASCRAGLKRILNSERVLVARVGPELVGKINTNAVSFSRYQIGGVYVRPEFRGRGIASRMTAVFLDSLPSLGEGMGASLFVKKTNPSAKAVYLRAGFTVRGNYRISYF